MRIVSEDEKRIVDVGTSDLFFSLYSTVIVRINNAKNEMPLAIEFLHKGECPYEKAQATARQINLIRDALASIPLEQIVYDYSDRTKVAPWEGNVSPVITSAGNFYITADGKDLLFEIASILVYADITKQFVRICP
ncbi:MAG: hypothetical protein IKG39_11950 [Lachnospiraceae bacterium]|nr:hypothetical protein [Lachnospiraceae bacterium]